MSSSPPAGRGCRPPRFHASRAFRGPSAQQVSPVNQNQSFTRTAVNYRLYGGGNCAGRVPRIGRGAPTVAREISLFMEQFRLRGVNGLAPARELLDAGLLPLPRRASATSKFSNMTYGDTVG